MTSRLPGKRILVVGAASGIGEAVTEAAVAEGARVVIADLAEAQGARRPRASGRLRALQRRRRNERDGRDGGGGGGDGRARRARQQRRPQKAGPVESVTVADWDALMGVNARGVFLATRAAIPHLRAAAAGRSSTPRRWRRSAGPGITAYAASKGR